MDELPQYAVESSARFLLKDSADPTGHSSVHKKTTTSRPIRIEWDVGKDKNTEAQMSIFSLKAREKN